MTIISVSYDNDDNNEQSIDSIGATTERKRARFDLSSERERTKYKTERQ